MGRVNWQLTRPIVRWKMESNSRWLISRVNRIWVVAATQPSPGSLPVQRWPGELWSVPFQVKCDWSVTGKLGKVRHNLKLCLPLPAWSLCAVNAVSCWCRSLGDIAISLLAQAWWEGLDDGDENLDSLLVLPLCSGPPSFSFAAMNSVTDLEPANLTGC